MNKFEERCYGCLDMIQEDGVMRCLECFKQACADIDDCPNGFEVVELTAEQKKVVKKMTNCDTHEVKKRSRPIDERKIALMNYLDEILCDLDVENIEITIEGREMEFDFEGGHFRLTLAMPRKEKK